MDEAVTACHYQHVSGDAVSAVTNCQSGQLRGFIATSNETLELLPQTDTLKAHNNRDPDTPGLPDDILNGVFVEDLYVVKKAVSPPVIENDEFSADDDFLPVPETKSEIEITPWTVELAVFLDAAGYNYFRQLYSDQQIEESLLALVNQLDALYHLPSLGRAVDFSIVKMEIFREQPDALPTMDGNATGLLEAFCR